jgi:two-component system cell cycle sensor histidine kinase/response regulator CckA
MNGLELARELVAIRPDIPIVLVTGFMEDLPPETIEPLGIRRPVKKPLTTPELAEAIAAALRKNAP